MKNTFDQLYPYLHLYVSCHGTMEVGADYHYSSWLRLLDEGGVRIECDQDTLHASLVEADNWAKEFMTDNYSEEVEKLHL